MQQALKYGLVLNKVQSVTKFKKVRGWSHVLVSSLNIKIKKKQILRKISIASWKIDYLIKQSKTIEKKDIWHATNEITRNRHASSVKFKKSKYTSDLVNQPYILVIYTNCECLLYQCH